MQTPSAFHFFHKAHHCKYFSFFLAFSFTFNSFIYNKLYLSTLGINNRKAKTRTQNIAREKAE